MQSADSNSTLTPTDSPLLGSSLICPVARSIGAPHRPSAFPFSENPYHPRSMPPPVPAFAFLATPARALPPVAFHHSTAPWPPNDVKTAASAERCLEPDAPPSARCSWDLPPTALPCSNSSKAE